MSTFDESKHRRDGEGKFASKGPSAEVDVRLDSSDGSLDAPRRRDVLADSWATKEDWELDGADPREVEVMTDPTDRSVVEDAIAFEGLEVSGWTDDPDKRDAQLDDIARRVRQEMFVHDGDEERLQGAIEDVLVETTDPARESWDEEGTDTRRRRKLAASTLAATLATRTRVPRPDLD